MDGDQQPCRATVRLTQIKRHFARTTHSAVPVPTSFAACVGSSFGTLFRITTFGESHGPALGVVVDGCPPKLPLDAAQIQHELDRRRPGQSRLVSQRKEDARVEILSGVLAGVTLGTPLAKHGVEIAAWADEVAGIAATVDEASVARAGVDINDVRCPDAGAAAQMIARIEQARKDGDSVGGCIRAVARGVPPGWGEPVFDKLEADLG